MFNFRKSVRSSGPATLSKKNAILASILVVAALSSGTLLFALATNSPEIPSGMSGRKITYTHYEGVAPRALITAKDAKPLPNDSILAVEFALTTFRDGNPTNIEAIIETPECIFNYKTHLATSTNRLKVYNAQTNFFIEGSAFSWLPGPTNILIISNDVHTVIERVTNAPVKNDSALNIYSDHFKFLAVLASNVNTRVAYYTDNVRAEDPDVRLTAEALTADLSSTNNVKNIVAERNVKIVSKTDNSEATGERAIYINESGEQLVELTGDPHWHDARNQGRARRFLFNRNSRKVWLEGDAEMQLPRSSVTEPDFLGLNGEKAKTTNDTIKVSANVLQIDLATNKSTRVLIAKKNVVILADNTRATADGALFSEATGSLRLTNGTWGGEQFIAKGQLLTFDRSNKVFHAENDAFLKLPAKSFGEAATSKKSDRGDNRSLEIVAQNYDIRTNIAVFNGSVRANFPAEINGSGLLQCDKLTAYFRSNKVEKLLAEGHIDLHETISNATNLVNRQVNCETLTVTFFTNGSARVIFAEHNVIADELSKNLTTQKEARRKLSANSVEMHFSAKTNQLERMVADRHAYIERDGSWAQADQLIYLNSDEKESAELIGFSKILYNKPGKAPIASSDEKGFMWDFRREVITAKSTFKAHSGTATNAPATKR